MANMIIVKLVQRLTKLSKEQADYISVASKYPIISIEDGMDENDWDGWKYLTELN